MKPETLNLHVPTKWNDLSARQILFVCRLFLANLSLHSFRVHAFCHFSGIQPVLTPHRGKSAKREGGEGGEEGTHFFLKGRKYFTIEAQEFLWFLKSMNFLAADSSLTVNRFPRIRILWKLLHGPRRNCFDITVVEFMHAEKCLHEFNLSHNSTGTDTSTPTASSLTYLNRLCAVLYRPNRHKPFDEQGYSGRARLFRLISMQKKYAIYIFYAGCRNALFKAFPRLFGSVISSSPVNPVENLKKTIYQLTLGDVTKTSQVEATPVWQAFSYLQDMMEQSKNAKDQRVNSKQVY